MREIYIIAELNLSPENREKLLPFLKEYIDKCRAEPGNILYDLTEDWRDPDRLCLVSLWESLEAFKAHNEMPHPYEFAEMTRGIETDHVLYILSKIH